MAAPRSRAAAAGLAASKKRKGTHTKHDKGETAHEFFGWDDSWDEQEDSEAALQALPVLNLDGCEKALVAGSGWQLAWFPAAGFVRFLS